MSAPAGEAFVRRAARSKWEESFALMLRREGIPFEREKTLIPGRKFRFDFAIAEGRILCEIDGGIFSGGRHVRGSGVESDSEKCLLASAEGWRVLRIAPKHIGLALEVVKRIHAEAKGD